MSEPLFGVFLKKLVYEKGTCEFRNTLCLCLNDLTSSHRNTKSHLLLRAIAESVGPQKSPPFPSSPTGMTYNKLSFSSFQSR